MLPYFWMSGIAVFSPIPGTPGTLSDASPVSPSTSMTLSGVTPNFCLTPSRSTISTSVPCLPGLKIFIVSEMSCMKSLSGVTRKVKTFSRSACFANVPMTSSASYPSISTIGMLYARTTSLMSGICVIISSGIFWRVALYSLYASWRNVGLPVSKTTAIWSGNSCERIRFRNVTKPYTALVFCHFEFMSGCRINAKYARYASAIASMR